MYIRIMMCIIFDHVIKFIKVFCISVYYIDCASRYDLPYVECIRTVCGNTLLKIYMYEQHPHRKVTQG